MIDLHSHVLPGVDDGAPDLPTSLELLRQAAEGGTTLLVATPHQHPSRYPNEASVLREAHERLEAARTEAVEAGEQLPEVLLGAEVHLDGGLLERVRDGSLLRLAGSSCLLLELPDVFPLRPLEHLLHELALADVTVLLAHPERIGQLVRHPSQLVRLVELGALVQVTALSVTGRFGRECRRLTESLLDAGLVHVVASDAHDPRRRPASLGEARRAVEGRCGPEVARRLFEETPRALLEDEPVRAPPFDARRLEEARGLDGARALRARATRWLRRS